MDSKLVSLSREIFELVSGMGKTLSAAESCSAGRIATILTMTPGCSSYFKGGLVSYMDEVKEQFLNVDAQLIDAKTAVCEEVAIQMVKGALSMFKSDYSISMTGFAGPDGGTEESPVGTIWVSVGSDKRIVTKKIFKNLGREENVDAAVWEALQLLRNFLQEETAGLK